MQADAEIRVFIGKNNGSSCRKSRPKPLIQPHSLLRNASRCRNHLRPSNAARTSTNHRPIKQALSTAKTSRAQRGKSRVGADSRWHEQGPAMSPSLMPEIMSVAVYTSTATSRAGVNVDRKLFRDNAVLIFHASVGKDMAVALRALQRRRADGKQHRSVNFGARILFLKTSFFSI